MLDRPAERPTRTETRSTTAPVARREPPRIGEPQADSLTSSQATQFEPPPAIRFARGECTGDGTLDLSDAVCILNWLFLDAEAPACAAATNINGDQTIDLSDPVVLLNYLFLQGPAPAAPFPDCAPSGVAADETLGCATPPERCE